MATFNSIDGSGNLVTVSVTIASGASLSSAVDLLKYSLVGIQMPGTWTAANLTFQGSYDGSTFANLYDETQEVTLTSPTASVYIVLDPAKYLSLRSLKVRSGTSGTPVNQGADRALQLILRQL